MKLTVLLCLTVVLVSCHVALARKKFGILGKIFNKKTPKPKDSIHKKDIPGIQQRPHQPAPGQGGIGEHGGYGGYPGQGGYPAQGRYPAQGGYPGHGGYPAQGRYPAQGGYPGHGGYPSLGGYPVHGGYPAQGGYINQNPNNHILSPYYGGSYGGYAPGGGSPYSRTVQAMGYVPSEKSKGFGSSAMRAAAGGAMAGMALGYGLGRFPRPHFHFHSPEEEYYYNYYMYRRYRLKPRDHADFSKDYNAPPVNYELFMHACMERKDLLPTPKQSKLTTKTPPAVTTTSTTTTTTSVSPSVSSNMTRNVTANSSTPAVSATIAFPKPPEGNPGASPGVPTVTAVSNADEEDDDDTVSVVEIGYPALIEQLKVRRCLELYVVNSEKNLGKSTTPKPRGGGERWESSHWPLLVTIFTVIMA